LKNKQVCGGSSLNCSNTCGSIQCAKCGYFNESALGESDECSLGLESTFLKLKFKTEFLDELYASKQNEIKKYLSNVKKFFFFTFQIDSS